MKFFAEEKTLLPSESWKNNIETKRIELVNIELKKNILYKDFKVTSAPENGQIVLKIEKVIPANERGLFLLRLEEDLKSSVDRGITVWCEPVGDKSKLRNLRGIKFSK
jgi:hypothetical protein|tara:strand:- start:254 stop:577 length:324 start_codon:yes stop_codon:yes gene_type:complete